MVDGFNAFDLDHHFRMTILDMLHKFGLFAGWSDDKNSAGIRNRLRDRFEKVLVFSGMPAANAVGLVMEMAHGIVGVHDQFVRIGPYSGGASTQRPPDFSTWMMPLITRRSSTRALPRVSVGRCGSIFQNCPSVSQN
jgi:hypothetical protein